MSLFMLHFITAWNDHFTGTYSKFYNSQTPTSRQNPSESSVYVLNCLFSSISSSSDGGALYITSATYFLVESTSFFSCKTSTQNGGAIYFSNSGGQSVLYKICSYDCCSTNTGRSRHHCAFIEVNNVASSKNYVNYSSISRSVNVNSNSYNNMCLFYGKILCPSVNFSLNKCTGNQFYCLPSTDSNITTCSFIYSSVTDNTATRSTCFIFSTGNAKYEIKSCNILRNTQGSLNTEGTIYANGNLMIEDSCILANTATYIFYQYSSTYTITLSKCTVDSTSNNQNLNIQNTVTESFILALNHMSTQNCHSEYDSIGTLTPIIQTPSSSKKQIHCYTYVKCFNQSLLIDFFSLICILIFNFIHPYPSINL
jgi:hypothetical protein